MSNAFTVRFPHSDKNAIIIDVAIEFVLPYENKKLSVTVKALIDTGANGSCISRRLASACRLERVSAMRILAAQGRSIAPVYEVDFRLPNGSVFQKIPVMEVAGSPSFDAIIGMDILTKSDFAVSNVDGNLIFTMRIPSENKEIDFCK